VVSAGLLVNRPRRGGAWAGGAARIAQVLSDPVKRRQYDLTGFSDPREVRDGRAAQHRATGVARVGARYATAAAAVPGGYRGPVAACGLRTNHNLRPSPPRIYRSLFPNWLETYAALYKRGSSLAKLGTKVL
jgi:hypothetical protein